MIVVNEVTKKIDLYYKCIRGIVYADDNYIEFGYFHPNKAYPKITYNNNEYYDCRKKLECETVFSTLVGEYRTYVKDDPLIQEHTNVFGNGGFPYSIEREYEAEHHIKLFKEDDRLNTEATTEYDFSKELKYSFGIEFETAAGFLPEDTCFELGLIPLRDGSISGVEYSTIPMSGNKGINLLKAQLEALKKYTYSNKECSVHVHLGGYPVQPKAIYILHTLWYYMQDSLLKYIPVYSYNTGAFKKNEKDYCKKVLYFNNFQDLFKFYVGQSYLGDLTQPHPNDVDKVAKWNIKTRYFNCNFINMLCYNAAKTVEFRFLTPTYSFEKLTTFLLIFNGILKYSELLYDRLKNATYATISSELNSLYITSELSVKNLITKVYSTTTCDMLSTNIKKLEWLQRTQYNVGDYNGGRLDIENRYFPDGKQEG